MQLISEASDTVGEIYAPLIQTTDVRLHVSDRLLARTVRFRLFGHPCLLHCLAASLWPTAIVGNGMIEIKYVENLDLRGPQQMLEMAYLVFMTAAYITKKQAQPEDNQLGL